VRARAYALFGARRLSGECLEETRRGETAKIYHPKLVSSLQPPLSLLRPGELAGRSREP